MILEPIDDQFLEDVPDLELNGEKTDTFLVGTKGSCEEDSCFTSENLKKDNYLSEFKYEYQKARARKNLGISSQETLRWGNISGYIEEQKDLQGKFEEINSKITTDIEGMLTKKVDKENALTQIKYTNDAYTHIGNLEDALNQLLYKDLTISISCNPNKLEIGESADTVTVSWTYNKKNIKTQTLNEENITIDNSVNSYTATIKGPFTSKTTWTLKAYDGTKNFSTTTTLYFYPAIYYGDALELGNFNGFTKLLQSGRSTTITVTSPNYIYIYIPHSYGAATFKVGGFEGGFTLINDSYKLENNSVLYRVYRSDNANLGNTTITIQ